MSNQNYPGIDPQSLEKFLAEAKQFEPLKNRVEEWLDENRKRYKKPDMSIYGLKHGFGTSIGYVTHGALTIWLVEWGYKVTPRDTARTGEGTLGIEPRYE